MDEELDKLRAENARLKQMIESLKAIQTIHRGVFCIPSSPVVDVNQPNIAWRMHVVEVPFVQAADLAIQLARFAIGKHVQEMAVIEASKYDLQGSGGIVQ